MDTRSQLVSAPEIPSWPATWWAVPNSARTARTSADNIFPFSRISCSSGLEARRSGR